MFWDKVASIYDFFETVYNGAVYRNTGKIAAKEINADDRSFIAHPYFPPLSFYPRSQTPRSRYRY